MLAAVDFDDEDGFRAFRIAGRAERLDRIDASGLDPRLATPRRESPRTAVPAGSVGIGGAQTGVYPLSSPGGWHLIGRTELALFDVARAEPSLLHVGDRVRFVAVGG